ncbi:MAG TPA: phage terminase large subunit family protein, partial [Sedimentisphaerales bacterium]|nr:phage terminase large subunit family protein [Sedimentisphaerales bacterium]
AKPERKQRAERDFRFFCESYFPFTFHLAWSPDHLKVIAKVEEAVLHGGLFAMAMPRGSGKALALDTPMVTPFGWTTMGEVKIGDLLFDEEGWPCRVVHATGVQFGRPCYRVCFSDGESIVCDQDHLWKVDDEKSSKNPLILTAKEMATRVEMPTNRKGPRRRYRIDLNRPLMCPEKDALIHPYVLGYWLGDGTTAASQISTHADDLVHLLGQLEKAGESASLNSCDGGNLAVVTVGKGHVSTTDRVRKLRRAMASLDCGVSTQHAANWSGLSRGSLCNFVSSPTWNCIRNGQLPAMTTRLREMGVLNNKHIPLDYLRAALWQRLALLQGLMDSDGTVVNSGRSQCIITLKDGPLAYDLGDLLSGLGIKWTRQSIFVERDGTRLGPYLKYRFTAYSDFPVFRLPRKRKRLRARPDSGGRASRRQIVSIERVPSVPVRCIEVDSPSKLYLAGRKMVPTHNSSLAETAAIWALLYGHREFVCLIGSDEGHAMDMLESIKIELDSNDLLLADFPEAVYPTRCLDGIANRCSGQLYKGERTHISWTAKEIVLPTIAGSQASGAIIRVAGITGRIRGMKSKASDGRSLRPSLVVIDDPQTDESARSLSQCATRESILAGAVLGLAGPGRKIAGVMPCTVIRPGDMADNILDRDKHPEWNGERTKMVYRFPSNEKLWQKYAEVRAESLRMGHGGHEATEFYRAHREAMDEGAAVAWTERFNHDELSAVQHAMNLKLQDEAAFFAEYQNEPLAEEVPDEDLLKADQVAEKINRLGRGVVAVGCNHLTMFIDVQAKLLFYVVAAWEDDFTGYVVDYGTWPDQKRPYFTLRDARQTLAAAMPGAGLEGSIYAGLERLTAEHLGREWRRDDGAALRIDRCLIDANWGSSTDVVYQFCRQSTHSGVVTPSHGRFVGASSIPFSEYRRKQGDRLGLNWRIPSVQGRRAVRHVLFDTNYWKSFVHARLAVPMGDRGC